MIGQVHSVGPAAVYVGASASDDALLLSLDEAVSRGLPLRVFGSDGDLSVNVLRRVSALAAGAFPAWRWLWSFDPSSAAAKADLLHVEQREGL